MNTPNFSSILDDTPTEVERPKPLPEGTYLCIVGAPRRDKSAKKGTELVEFLLKPIAIMEDVNEEELEAMGGLDGRSIKATYYITNEAKWRLDEFHEHCGLDLSEPMKRSTRNDMVVNQQVLAYIKHEQATDGSDQVFAKLRRTAPAEE